MRKATLTFLALVLTLALSLGPVAMAETAESQLGDYMNGKVINMRFLRIGERISSILKEYFDDLLGIQTGVFETTDAGIENLLLSLQTGKIDGLMTWSFEAEYFAKLNPDFLALKIDYATYLTASMIVSGELENAEEVTEMLNGVIAEMGADGTLEALEDKYVTNLTAETQAESIEIPYTDGAPTYRVVVTGWAVPLDYFDASGSPMGFDAAMLAEIAKRKNVNFEVVLYEPGSGVMAISTGKADINFCYTTTYDTEEMSNEDCSYEFEVYDDNGEVIGSSIYKTDPYFRATEMMLLVKK